MARKKNLQGDAKRKLTSLIHEYLEWCLNEMQGFCHKSDDRAQWPSDQFLDRFSEAIRRSASIYHRGGETLWDCVKAVENRRPSLKLRKRIEDLVKRARQLYLPEPRARQIRKQGLDGSEPSKKCFEALRECYEGKSQFTSIKWEEHGDILNPNSARGETCEGRAAQICIDWLRWKLVDKDISPLVFWLMRIGNPELLKTIGYSGRADIFDTIRRKQRDRERREVNKIRKQRSRLKAAKRDLARQWREIEQEKREIEQEKRSLVREELDFLDSNIGNADAHDAATRRLMRHTGRTSEDRGKILRQ